MKITLAKSMLVEAILEVTTIMVKTVLVETMLLEMVSWWRPSWWRLPSWWRPYVYVLLLGSKHSCLDSGLDSWCHCHQPHEVEELTSC